MKKQVLVSVDRGETRVALLEADRHAGAPPECRRPAPRRTPPPGYRVAELYLERRGNRSIVGNIYKGKVDNVLPGLEAAFVDIGLDKNGFLHVDEIVLPGVETPAPRPRQGGRQEDHRPAQARPGGRRPGRQGPAEDQGRAAVDGAHHRRALHGLHADRRGRRRLQAPRRQGARAPAQGGQAASTCDGGGAIIRTAALGRQARGLRARAAVPVQAPRGPAEARRGGDGAGARLPGGGPLGPRRARHLLEPTSSARSSTTRSSTTGSSRSSPAPRRSSSTASSSTRSPRRCSRPTASRRSSTASSRAASTCPAAAT